MERKEIWKDIEGYEELYQISDKGRVKSLSKRIECDSYVKVSNKGRVKSLSKRIECDSYVKVRKERILKCKIVGKGYLRVNLHTNNKNFTGYYVHRLVAKHFILNPKNKSEVNHINGIKIDNRAENLEWRTHFENMSHGYQNGFINSSGENAPLGKLTWKKVKAIREEYKKGNITQKELGKKYGVRRESVWNIVNYKTWI